MLTRSAGDATLPEYEKLRIVIPAGQQRERLDRYLTHHIQNATRTKVQRGIEQEHVRVNGKPVKASYLVQPGDILDITLPRPPRQSAKPEDIPIEIVYEDEQLLVVNKRAGMVTHPAYANYEGTLVNALLHHTDVLSSSNPDVRPGIVHRLDKDTSGLLVVAKTDAAHAFLARQFSKHTIEREYWAIVWGVLKKEKATIDAALGRSKRDRKKIAVMGEGKQAVTEYEIIRRLGFLTLVRLRLKTGRTHQIRVHMAHIGHPVFGDATYGGRSNTWGGLTGKKAQQAANLLKQMPRQALHAKSLGFLHPKSNALVRFDSELPTDMKALVEACGT